MKLNVTKLYYYFILLVVFSSCDVEKADIILSNGKIFTSDTTQLYVQALAIRKEKIIAIGSNAEIEKYATKNTTRINLEGRTVIPGINDAHNHLGWYSPIGISYQSKQNDIKGINKKALLDSLVILIKKAKKNQWISGWIGTEILFDTTMRVSLDSLKSKNPIVLQAWWGHGQIVNENTLHAAGISDENMNPLGGRYIRNSSGKINTIHENAQLPIWNAWFTSEYKNQIKGLRAYSEIQLQGGITTVQHMSSTFNDSMSEQFFKDANLPQRIRIISWPKTDSRGRQMPIWNQQTVSNIPNIYFSGVKYMIDGTPIEKNALNKNAYSKNDFGYLNYPADSISTILNEALSNDCQLMMHITGDSSLAIVLSQMKKLASDKTWKSKRVRIEHNSILQSNMTEINDFKNLGLLVMHTPKYNQASPISSLLKKGVLLGIAPDGTTNPFWDMMVITSQQSNPNENITREQAVIAYTKTNAYAEFQEKIKGTLNKGMLADLVVLSQDIFTIPSVLLPTTTSVLTMVNGKIVFAK
ncbi:MAG: hypothetical protein B7Y11_09430 [Sphingobacteriia bacterium 24-36-13]|jgi:predicted amidohydrolase YtcJ|uniref:amidohydrolase n=1 Tax=Sediminibacterium sp. TaxID=1917865 RepID=UPI000BD5E91F|nr:amidohydrolase family protein [Sediminibacterium sp.]OYZ53589.1 MAG: hypothetical protein B7Y11_09430 [Sphingobacteriia bacterium 24-36-13]OZA63977.1 MAG: hypothetical protein B7X68_08915 [Sphingobacteriia bacterium 39-36-14]HQS24700.1 amidohydrolase family protein [Sediminibacterium sp.]HQS35022.1 amidohydrolase family protein [Sediminibacterium sp.]